MKFDLNRFQLEPRYLAMLQALVSQHLPSAEVWAYGSRLHGGHQECSDIDLMVRNPSDLTTPLSRSINRFSDALDDSSFPFFVDVFDWALVPPHFHATVLNGYVVLSTGPVGPHGHTCSARDPS